MTRITECRSCKSERLREVLSLGEIAVINMGDKEPLKSPLELVFCEVCGLVQLRHTVDPEYLFRNYYYKSGVNRTMRNELRDIVESAMKRVKFSEIVKEYLTVNIKSADIVIDIGANDGTLLSFYPSNLRRVGFEPAMNMQGEKAGEGITIIPDFFSADSYFKLFTGGRKAKIITAIAMFYDLDDPNAFLENVKKVLATDGVFVIQQNYVKRMLELNAFDNIVHEHLEYYSVRSLAHLLNRHGLFIDGIEFNDVNGGSFRVYVRHMRSNFMGPAIEAIRAIADEEQIGLRTLKPYLDFAERVKGIAKGLHDFIAVEVAEGKKVYVGGASTRGNTLLQVAKLDRRLIEAAVDRNPAKWGKKYGDIPIISEEEARKHPPDFMLMLPWHFFGEFIEREQVFLKKGDKIIVPLPEPAVLEMRPL